MARLPLLLSRALTSRPLLPPPPSPLTHSLRPPPRYSSARPPLPVRAPPPPHGSRLLLLAAAATRYYATSSHGRRKRVPPRPLARRRARRTKGPVELIVQIGIEEELPDDPLVLSIAETLQTDVGKAMKVAFENLKGSEYKTRDNAINDVEKYDNVEVSLLLCNDSFIRKLNKEWRDEDQATDVLSMSQHIPGLDIPILQLGDIVISVATAHRQAEERGHTLLDEIRILMVHGLLHLLGFDHELSREAEQQMEKEEERILKILEWKGKGLISSAHDVASSKYHSENFDESSENIEKMSVREAHEPKLSHIIYDIDGNLVDYEGHLHPKSIEALREALSRGVKVITSTRNSRAATIRIFKLLDFEGKENVVSTSSPGVFLQGSLVYGRQGQEIYRANLDMDICKEAFMHSLKHMVPLVACCEDKWLTLFEHPSVDLLHTMCHEAKAIVMPSIEDILAYSSIQKLLFLDNAEGASSILRQHLSELTEGQARLIQMQSNMVEIVPFAASKSGGLRILLDHLGIAEDFDLEEVEDCTRWLSDHKDS